LQKRDETWKRKSENGGGTDRCRGTGSREKRVEIQNERDSEQENREKSGSPTLAADVGKTKAEEKYSFT